jgi:hypothetical protein
LPVAVATPIPAPILRKPTDLSTATMLADIQNELGAMKEEYQKLTGKSYEGAVETKKKRRIIRRYWRSSSTDKTPSTEVVTAVTAGNTAANAGTVNNPLSVNTGGGSYGGAGSSPLRVLNAGTSPAVGLVTASAAAAAAAGMGTGASKVASVWSQHPAHWSEPVRFVLFLIRL